MDNAYVDIICD